jgi:hypothetical protein
VSLNVSIKYNPKKSSLAYYKGGGGKYVFLIINFLSVLPALSFLKVSSLSNTSTLKCWVKSS